jgi:hypothetical protein
LFFDKELTEKQEFIFFSSPRILEFAKDFWAASIISRLKANKAVLTTINNQVKVIIVIKCKIIH